jgi:hypothetical protein
MICNATKTHLDQAEQSLRCLHRHAQQRLRCARGLFAALLPLLQGAHRHTQQLGKLELRQIHVVALRTGQLQRR